jgi:beta-galactosidase
MTAERRMTLERHPAGYTKRALTLDGQEFFLYAGDIQYARTSRSQWADSLEMIRVAGCNTILTYVPWNWHELCEGVWDWEGRTCPERDLPAFLGAVHGAGLKCILRIGPFITAEWKHGGIPSWLLRDYPQILALNSSGQSHIDLDYPPITYLHPDYEGHVRRYFAALVPVITDSLSTRGGPIIGVQLEDEPSYWQGLRDGSEFVDYSAQMIGEEGFYRSWLARSHSNIETLNSTYRAAYASFEDVAPPIGPPRSIDEMPAHLDWYHCKLDAIAEHCFRLHDWITELGVDVPLFMLFPYHTLQASTRFTAQAKERGLTFLTGCECYIATQGVATFGEDHVGTIAGIHEIHKTWSTDYGTPPMNFETQAAVGFHIPAAAMEALITLEIGHGLNGISFYMIAGGDTPSGYELMYGRSYDSSSPIGAAGEIREHFTSIARIGELVGRWGGQILEASNLQDMAIGYYEPYEATSYLGNSLDWGLRDDYRDVFLNYFGVYYHERRGPTLYTLLALSGINYGSIDLERATADEMSRWSQIWVPGLDFMSAAVQLKLVDYVKQGGNLVMLPTVPRLDEAFVGCEILDELFPAQPLNARPGTPLGRFTRHTTIDAPGVTAMAVADYVDEFDPPDDAQVIATRTEGSRPCAYRRNIGQGSATLLGFKLSYWWDAQIAHKRFVDHIFRLNGGHRSASAEGWELVVRARLSDHGGFLFVVNPQELRVTAPVSYLDPATGDIHTIPRRLPGVSFARQGGLTLPIGIDLGPSRIEYSTTQVLSTSVRPGRLGLKLHGQPGTDAELCLSIPFAPTAVRFSGSVHAQDYHDGLLTLVLTNGSQPTWLHVEFSDIQSGRSQP